MSNFKMIVLTVLVVALLNFSSKAFIFETGVSSALVDNWQQEMQFINQECQGKVPMPVNFVVKFDETDDAIGYCQHYANGFKIVLNRDYWLLRLNRVGRRQLLLHEMMHCIFNIRHNSTNSMHFMYPEFIEIPEEELLNQAREVIKSSKKCN